MAANKHINLKVLESWMSMYWAEMRPVPELGSRGLLWAGLIRKPIPNEPNTGPKQPGPSALAIWDLSSVYARNRSNTCPGRQARGPETLSSQQSVQLHITNPMWGITKAPSCPWMAPKLYKCDMVWNHVWPQNSIKFDRAWSNEWPQQPWNNYREPRMAQTLQIHKVLNHVWPKNPMNL